VEDVREHSIGLNSDLTQQEEPPLPSLADYWDSLASYGFTPKSGTYSVAKFFALTEIAERSLLHEKMQEKFWDAAFHGTSRPARPRDWALIDSLAVFDRQFFVR
jgi:hypothetical protein